VEERPGRSGLVNVPSVRYFNTTGPCLPERHYTLPPERRLPGARRYIDRDQYFVVHAPRQSGKTTALGALARQLTAEGHHVAVYFSCERAAAFTDDVGAASDELLAAIRYAAEGVGLPPEQVPPPWPDEKPGSRIIAGLRAWATQCPLPLVLLFDEIDALQGLPLRSVLSQLREGYNSRPIPFPVSVALCGLRDVRDYRAASGGDPSRLGSTSPFNIVVESMRIANFTADEVAALYGQHTVETGQEFTPDAVRRAFDYTQGQPWLVNALAGEVLDRLGVEPPAPITAEHIDEAKERLVLARATHLDSLAARLAEPRVRRIIEPVVTGGLPDADLTYNDDVVYVRDLGLIAERQRPLVIANPIYREVIVRVLGESVEDAIAVGPHSFLLPDGRLDIRALLEGFAAFWREHGEVLASTITYQEAARGGLVCAGRRTQLSAECTPSGRAVILLRA
jgi:hypothetical protein